MANVKIQEEYKVMEQGKERYNMCKAVEDMREDGVSLMQGYPALQNLRQKCKTM